MNATGPVGSAFLLSRVGEGERGLASSVNQGSWMLFNGVGTFVGGFLWSPGAVAGGIWMWAFAGTAGFYAVNTVLYYRWFRAVDDRPAKEADLVDAPPVQAPGAPGSGVALDLE